MEQREEILARFAAALNLALREKVGKVPSTSKFAEMFNALCAPQDRITRETARKWLKGIAYPEVSRLQALMRWLALSPSNILTTSGTDAPASTNSGPSESGGVQRTSVRFAQQALDALSASIAVIDADGVICQVNRTWTKFAQENGGSTSVQAGIGLNYLDVCGRARSEDSAAGMADAIRAVLAGTLEEFSMKYPCHSATESRWFVSRTTGFDFEGRRYAVVSHECVSEENWRKLDFPQLPPALRPAQDNRNLLSHPQERPAG